MVELWRFNWTWRNTLREYIIKSKSVENVAMNHDVKYQVCISKNDGCRLGRIPDRLILIFRSQNRFLALTLSFFGFRQNKKNLEHWRPVKYVEADKCPICQLLGHIWHFYQEWELLLQGSQGLQNVSEKRFTSTMKEHSFEKSS